VPLGELGSELHGPPSDVLFRARVDYFNGWRGRPSAAALARRLLWRRDEPEMGTAAGRVLVNCVDGTNQVVASLLATTALPNAWATNRPPKPSGILELWLRSPL
jgi:hypothetical protein